jgi:hypothetical protein
VREWRCYTGTRECGSCWISRVGRGVNRPRVAHLRSPGGERAGQKEHGGGSELHMVALHYLRNKKKVLIASCGEEMPPRILTPLRAITSQHADIPFHRHAVPGRSKASVSPLASFVLRVCSSPVYRSRVRARSFRDARPFRAPSCSQYPQSDPCNTPAAPARHANAQILLPRVGAPVRMSHQGARAPTSARPQTQTHGQPICRHVPAGVNIGA